MCRPKNLCEEAGLIAASAKCGAQRKWTALLVMVLSSALCTTVKAAVAPGSLVKLTEASKQQLEDLPFLLNEHERLKKALVLREAPGFEPPIDDEFQALLRDNMEEDFAFYFRDRKTRSFTLKRLKAQVLKAYKRYPYGYVGLVLIKNGTVYSTFKGQEFAYQRVRRFGMSMQRYARRLGLNLPDTVFALNALDEPICSRLSKCVSAPIFSFFKRFSTRHNRSIDRDILLPHLGHIYGKLFFYPWHQKDQRAMLRASYYKTMETDCMRVQLAKLSQTDHGNKFLDVGLVGDDSKQFSFVTNPRIEKKQYVNLEDHPKWKFLINSDGHTASCRMGHIMQMNSVILKEDSAWIEYYYRSLKPGVHYLPFSTADGLMDMLMTFDNLLKTQEGDYSLRNIANNSQHFSYKFLGQEGKVRYAHAVLTRYTELFGGTMEAFIRGLDLSKYGELYTTSEGTKRYNIKSIKRIISDIPDY